MRYDVITLFPELIDSYCNESIIGRARKQDVISVNTINPRDFSNNKHKKVDDVPYGGGAGMVLMCEPFFSAFESVGKLENSQTVLLSPQGKPFNHELAREFSKKEQLILICGRYEGFDERIKQGLDLIEVSLGDFVLTGGELAALCIIDSVSRYIKGSLGKEESANFDTFENDLLEYPQYTRPYDFRGMKVPDMLLSGHHKKIQEWRLQKSIEKTKEKRPDLYDKYLQKQK